MKKYISQVRSFLHNKKSIFKKSTIPYYFLHPVVFIFYIINAIIFTYPIVFKMTSHLNDLGDPVLVSYLLKWHADNLFKADSGWFELNGFYPFNNDALLFSETFYLLGFFSYFISFIFDNPIFVYNILLLGAFVLNGYTMFLLAKYYTKNTFAAIIAGLFYSISSNKFGNLGHLHVISVYFIPLTILFFDKFLNSIRKKDAFLFGLFFSLAGLISVYQFNFLVLTLSFLLILKIALLKPKFIRKYLMNGLLALIPVIFLLAPIYANHYLFSKDYGTKRSIEENIYYSADLSSILMFSRSNIMYGDSCNTINALFDTSIPCYEMNFGIGLFPLLLIIYLFFEVKKVRKDIFSIFININKKQVFFLFMALFTYILALGPYLKIFGVNSNITLPYILIYELFVPLQGIRVPGRISMIFYIFISLLISLGLIKIIKSNLGYYKKGFILSIFLGFLIIENINIPLKLHEFKIPETKAFEFIKNNAQIKNIYYFPDTDVYIGGANPQLYSTKFGYKKLVNGYSGFFPIHHIQFRFLLDNKENIPEEFYNILTLLEVDTILVKKDSFTKNISSDKTDMIFEDDLFSVYKIALKKEDIKKCSLDALSVNINVLERKSNNVTSEVSFSLKEKDCYWKSNSVPTELIKLQYEFDSILKEKIFYIQSPLFIEPNGEYKFNHNAVYSKRFLIFDNNLDGFEKAKPIINI